MASLTNKVVSFGPPKEAALYFDEVLPFDMAAGLLYQLPSFNDSSRYAGTNFIPLIDGQFDDKILINLTNNKKIYPSYAHHISVVVSLFIAQSIATSRNLPHFNLNDIPLDEMYSVLRFAGFNKGDFLKSVYSDDFNLSEFAAVNEALLTRYIYDTGFKKADIWHPDFVVSGQQITQREDTPSDVLIGVSLKDLNLVDVGKISWDAVLEFRNDTKSCSSLRDFRIFFSKNFEGKSPNQISDELHSILHEYEITRKAWGFETAKKTFSAAVSQQGLITSSIGTLSAALLGAGGSALAGIGATITLGSCALEFGQIMIDRWKDENTRPTRFLTQLKQMGEANPG